MEQKSFFARWRANFVTGLFIVLPGVISVSVLVKCSSDIPGENLRDRAEEQREQVRVECRLHEFCGVDIKVSGEDSGNFSEICLRIIITSAIYTLGDA